LNDFYAQRIDMFGLLFEQEIFGKSEKIFENSFLTDFEVDF